MKTLLHPYPVRLGLAVCLVASGLGIGALAQKKTTQDDTVFCPEVSRAPLVDGKSDDQCWQTVPWQDIGQVWIPYGMQEGTGHYSGRYKVVWSTETNLLYFLIEVRDSVFVDGYIPGATADIYNFDIVEVFIDEDASGGPHVFDGSGDFGHEWGTKAANAFAYHIYARFPQGEGVTADHYVGDMGGTGGDDVKTFNYAEHLPDFALRKAGNAAVWEFSLIVYDDTYKENRREAARVKLAPGKVLGLTVAYCDNDHPAKDPKVRDFMFGSVQEPSPGNLHWKNADYYGRAKLVSQVIPRNVRK